MSTTIEAHGSTTLVQSGANYYLVATDGSSVELSYGGAAVVAGQFGAWTLIGAEKTASGYEVAWALPGADQYAIWYLDNSGNYLSGPVGTVSGESSQLQSFEVSFQQDLNGDGRIGLPGPTAIESSGSTTLSQNGSNYFLSHGWRASRAELRRRTCRRRSVWHVDADRRGKDRDRI